MEKMHKKLTIYKSNDLTESAYKLTLNEQRVLLACIAQINSNEPLTVTDKFELSAKNFATVFDVDERGAYDQLTEVARSLYKRELIIDAPENGVDLLQTRWISSIRYQKAAGKIVLRFAQDILPYLSGFKEKFTRYELINISSMNSIYGIRLYELLSQWQSVGRRDIEISWLKKQFEIEQNYSSISDLKKYVIEPAVKSINEKTNLTVTHAYGKTGRNVTHILFEFKEKKAQAKNKRQKPAESTKLPEKATVDNIEYFVKTLNGLRGNVELRNKIIQTIPPVILEQVLSRVTN